MKRIAELDTIRGVAVLLVLLRHGTWDSILKDAGWIGVDLFFVLSGFLVSGIVFSEFRATGTFNFKRFFIRRGFKIYPAFYFFLFFSLAVNYFEHGISYEFRLIAAELFFLQSYLPHVWTHTWSVAVEEHFYLALGIIASWRIRFLGDMSRNKLLWFLAGVLMLILFMRFMFCIPKRHREEFSFFSTHLRADGVVIGVMVAYIVYFTTYIQHVRLYRFWLMMLAALLILPAFVMKGGGFFMNTIGLTLLNVGFGIIVLLSAVNGKLRSNNTPLAWKCFSIPVGYIGIHSYSIYLWHLLILQELSRFDWRPGIGTFYYVLLSIVLGIIFSFVIEQPFLRWRERSIWRKQDASPISQLKH